MAGEEWICVEHSHKEAEGQADVRTRLKGQRRANGKRSKIRALVEHPFARMKGAMALFIRTIGIDRARTRIGMANLAYNFQRLAWLNGKAAPA